MSQEMKNVKGFKEFSINENDQKVDPRDWKEFVKLMRELKFEEAFKYAMDFGIFGGTFDDYLESRQNMGSAMNYLTKSYEAYVAAAEELAENIIEDVEDAMNNYGMPKDL